MGNDCFGWRMNRTAIPHRLCSLSQSLKMWYRLPVWQPFLCCCPPLSVQLALNTHFSAPERRFDQSFQARQLRQGDFILKLELH